MQDYNKLFDEIMENIGKFSKQSPEQMHAFHNFMEAVEKDSALKKKDKALIAIACAVVAKCEWCVAFHVKGALEAGATKEEILESAWVGVMMGGGPSLMYSQGVLKALEDMKKE